MKVAMKVRLAEAQDDTRVGELLVESFMTAYARKMPEVVYDEERKRDLRDMATKRREATVLVGEVDGEVVGTVMVYAPGVAKNEAWLPNAADVRQLAIAPAHFGKGYSEPLMDEAERIAWSWGVGACVLHVRRGAIGVSEVYQKRGYVRAPEGDRALPTVYLEAYLLRRGLLPSATVVGAGRNS